MNTWRLVRPHVAWLGMAWMLLLGGCTTASTTQARAPIDPAERYILVMLKEEPLRHFRPDAAYGASYQPSAHTPAAERTIAEINREYGLTRVEDWPMPSLGLRCYLEALGDQPSRADVLTRLAADARVESVEPLQRYRTLTTAPVQQAASAPGDPYYSLQTSARWLQLDQLHRMATGRHVRIAQIDSAAERAHPDLAGQIVDAADLVGSANGQPNNATEPGEAHGTEVAGIIVAKANNGVGIVGVAPGAELLALRACWQTNVQDDAATCSSFTLAKAVQYAMTHRAQVLNLSLAGPPDRLLTRLLQQAHEQGISIVSAVDPAAAPGMGFPASLPFVIGVAGLNASTRNAVAAPSERVLTTTPHASWGFVSGNSFAAAHVSGLLALLIETAPRLPPADISRLLHDHMRTDAATGPQLDACGLLAAQMHAASPSAHAVACPHEPSRATAIKSMASPPAAGS